MTNYPNADNSPGYVYDPDPGGLAYHNARSTGRFTIDHNATTTVIDTDARAGDIVFITAANLKAAWMTSVSLLNALSAGIYVSSVDNDSFTVTHDHHNNAEGAVFYYAVFPSV
jgi:hypothetical protein